MRDLASSALDKIHPYRPKSISENIQARFTSMGGLCNLAANENPIGASPLVLEALQQDLKQVVNRYSLSNQEDLRTDLAKFHNLDRDWIHLGAGIEEILTHISRAFLVNNDEVILSEQTFPLYAVNNQLQGATQHFVELNDLSYNLAGFSAKMEEITAPPRMIYLCNPNNPTGTIFDRDSFERLIQQVPQDCILVLDEAYYEYVRDTEFPDGVTYLNRIPRLIVTRTFSKAYGLAGLRIGYSMQHPDITKILQKLKPLHSINNLAEKCARIALSDQEHLEKVVQYCHVELDFLERCLKQTIFKRVKVLRSEANFLICELPIDSNSVAVRLMNECGIFVAPLGGFGLNQWIRVSPGTRSQNEKFLNGLRIILEDFEC
tara:strand:+ start:386 stop:1513 length:1128 start_codon:yes stop_codon:yes gene_type:complete